MSRYNYEGLLRIVPRNPPAPATERGCCLILHRLNEGQEVVYYALSLEHRTCVDVLIENEYVEIREGMVEFAKTFTTWASGN